MKNLHRRTQVCHSSCQYEHSNFKRSEVSFQKYDWFKPCFEKRSKVLLIQMKSLTRNSLNMRNLYRKKKHTYKKAFQNKLGSENKKSGGENIKKLFQVFENENKPTLSNTVSFK